MLDYYRTLLPRTSNLMSATLATMALSGTEVAVAAPETIVEVQLVEDIGAADRVEAVDRLRTLSQEVPSAACHLYNSVAVDESRTLLSEGSDEFDAILDALYNGNPAMNIIGAETNRKTLAELDKVKSIWSDIRPAVAAMLANSDDAAAIKIIKERNMPLYEETNILLSYISGEYSNPAELLQADAIMIDITGRQSMLTQMMAKDACKIWTGTADDAVVENLASSLSTFDLILNALRNGMPEAGVKAAPTPEIAGVLDGIAVSWSIVKPKLEGILAGNKLNEDQRTKLYTELNKKMYEFDDLVHLYTIYAKHQY
ncbi:MAG: type IV pili methyl-accepting chemotaxis transducer N-terminal domain-containing protein [Pseudomonadota bacterium]